MPVCASHRCWGGCLPPLLLVALAVVLAAGTVAAQEIEDGDKGGAGVVVMVAPEELKHMIEGTNHTLTWYSGLPNVARVTASVDDEMVAAVTSVSEVEVLGGPNDNFTYSGHFNVSALFIGYNKIHLTLYDDLDVVVGERVVNMSVLLAYQNLTDLFTLLIGILVAIVYVNMGATIDLQIVKGIVKKPVGPIVGMVCQYLFMPLIALGIGMAAFPDNRLGQLGMFLMGCCPGGGASNMWTHLMGGSLDLSIMMTFVSSVAAFAAVPLWVLLMGGLIMGDTQFVIPYKDIASLVLMLSIPCCIGVLIQKFLPRVANVLKMLLTPMAIFNLVFIFTFGVYANRYVFSIFGFKTLLAGFGLPTLGYLSGLVLASLLRLPLADRIAISIETGIQNATVALLILKLTLEKPAGDLTVVFPAASVLMTPFPLIIAVIARRIYLCRRSKSEDISKELSEDKLDAKMASTKPDLAPPPDGGHDNPAIDLKEEAV